MADMSSTGATCVAYTYVPYASPSTGTAPACVLKSAIGLSTFKVQSFDLSTGLIGACGTSVLSLSVSKPRLMTFFFAALHRVSA
jgi:hypothetical protein